MKLLLASLLLTCFLSVNYTSVAQVQDCYISLKKVNKLKAKGVDKLPAEADHTRKLVTQDGEFDITIVDGCRVLYYNSKNVPFVNLKVETLAPERYETDKQHILAELKYLNNHSSGMETTDLIELKYNSFTIYGISRNNTEGGSILGTFVMFPGNNTVVYFYFNNIEPAYANFKNLSDYQSQRNDFIGQYTNHLNTCKGK